MNPRKNTVNNLADVRDPARVAMEDLPRRRSRIAWLASIIRPVARPVAKLSRTLSRRLGKGRVAPGTVAASSGKGAVPVAAVAESQMAEGMEVVPGDETQTSNAAAAESSRPAAAESQKVRRSRGIVRILGNVRRWFARGLAQFLASLTFYTLLPIPFPQHQEFHRIARFAPWVGLSLGFGLGIVDWGLGALGMTAGLRTAIVVVSWLGLTGGLHMDGAMDSADGLAVTDPKRRLAVMGDSVTGAFGVMVAISLLLLKFSALMALPVDPVSRTVVLMAAMGWGRWGQVLAIDRYVYLKVEGKGAFHKRQLRSPDDLWPGLIALLGLSALFIWLFPARWMLAVGMVLGGFAIAFGTGAWFDRQLGGHTGDTYGAVVEWTEALLLCLLTLL